MKRILENIKEAYDMPQDAARDAYIEFQKALLTHHVLKLRANGEGIADIARKTGMSITGVCEVLYYEKPSYSGVF